MANQFNRNQRAACFRPFAAGLPVRRANVRVRAMKWLTVCATLLWLMPRAMSQENSPAPSQLDALSKKIDVLNAKVDTLSQQLSKLEQQIARPGVMIGESAPPATPAAIAVSPAAPPPAASAAGNTHVVAKGETLTSIAKQNKVGVEDLQKFNHIEDGRKLQAGQTIMIPPAAGPSASASAAATVSPSP